MQVISNPEDHFKILCTLKDGNPNSTNFEWEVKELNGKQSPYDTNTSCYYYDWGAHSNCCDESAYVTVRCTVKASKYGWREVSGTLQLGKTSFN